jgi:hypothetical protein
MPLIASRPPEGNACCKRQAERQYSGAEGALGKFLPLRGNGHPYGAANASRTKVCQVASYGLFANHSTPFRQFLNN